MLGPSHRRATATKERSRTDQHPPHDARDAAADDTRGQMINLDRMPKPPAYDHNGGLYPYQITSPSTTDAYVIWPSGDRYPYP